MRKGSRRNAASLKVFFTVGLSIHSAHIAAGGSRGSGRSGDIRYHAFGGEKRCRYGSRVLQYGTGNFRRIDDAAFYHIAILVVQRVEAEIGFLDRKSVV